MQGKPNISCEQAKGGGLQKRGYAEKLDAITAFRGLRRATEADKTDNRLKL